MKNVKGFKDYLLLNVVVESSLHFYTLPIEFRIADNFEKVSTQESMVNKH